MQTQQSPRTINDPIAVYCAANPASDIRWLLTTLDANDRFEWNRDTMGNPKQKADHRQTVTRLLVGDVIEAVTFFPKVYRLREGVTRASLKAAIGE